VAISMLKPHAGGASVGRPTSSERTRGANALDEARDGALKSGLDEVQHAVQTPSPHIAHAHIARTLRSSDRRIVFVEQQELTSISDPRLSKLVVYSS